MDTETHNIIEVIEFCRARDLPAEVVGRWVWVRFKQKPSAEVRQAMKDYGFRWVKRREMWAHNCGHPSHHGRVHPWQKYGHTPVGAVSDDNLPPADYGLAIA